jgi:hypothetical protein
MNPSEHLKYLGEHPHIKKKDAKKLAARILSNYGTTYNRPAIITAMTEMEIAMSLVDMIDDEDAKAVVNRLQAAHDVLHAQYYEQ